MCLLHVIDLVALALIIRGQSVTKLVYGLLPVSTQRQVVHGEGGVPSHLILDLEEGGQRGFDLLIFEGGECLEEDEVLAPGVAGRLVHVQLVLLVLVQEAPPSLEDWKMRVIPVGEKVEVVPLGDGLLHLHCLALDLGLAHCKSVGGPPILDSFPQPSLESTLSRVKVVMHNLEICELDRKLFILRQGGNNKLDLSGVSLESVSDVDAYPSDHQINQLVDLLVKV